MAGRTVKGTARDLLSRAGTTMAGIIPATIVAGLGMPALGALVFLAVLVIVAICWIIGNEDRTERASRLLLARRGDASSLAPRKGRTSRTPKTAAIKNSEPQT